MHDRDWLAAVRDEIAHMADDMETQRKAYVDLITRSDELRADLDRTAAAYQETLGHLERILQTPLWRAYQRLSRMRGQSDDPPPGVQELQAQPVGRPSAPTDRVAHAPHAHEAFPVVPANAVPDIDWHPRVSIIVPTRDQPDLLGALLATLPRTDWPDYEVVLVDNGTTDPAASALLRDTSHTVVRDDGPFNFPRLIASGVAASTGEVLVLLNNDIEVNDPNWLTALVACLSEPGCGIAGALLLYPDGAIQHAGMELDGVEPRHELIGVPLADAPADRLAGPRACAAVTGACLALRRSTWERLGGLEPLFARNYNDVDLCLRAAEAGAVTMITPAARLTHHESATRGDEWDPVLAAEGVLFRARWQRADRA